MTNPTYGPRPGYTDPAGYPPYGGMPVPYIRASLGGRAVAYLLDLLFILVFTAILGTAIFLVGIVTFGLGWALFPILGISGILYSAITVGGSRQSTIGMRMMGLRVVAPESGRPVDMLTAAVHALLFYVAISTFLLWCLDILFGLVRADRRLGHDVLLGLAVVRV